MFFRNKLIFVTEDCSILAEPGFEQLACFLQHFNDRDSSRDVDTMILYLEMIQRGETAFTDIWTINDARYEYDYEHNGGWECDKDTLCLDYEVYRDGKYDTAFLYIPLHETILLLKEWRQMLRATK